jgi:SAM-dependent methyltransferase
VSECHTEPSEDRIFFFEKQEVVVDDFDSSGYILDIGGGGEGVIGKLKGKQVVAIDPNKRELEEAAPGPLKVIMDARDLQFLDGTFSTATSFFTLMYIRGPDHEKVFSEVFRVLVPGGLFLIWDVILPQCPDETKDIAAFPLLIKLPNEEISTGYGTLWPEKEQDLSYYLRLAGKAGFNVIEQREHNRVLFLKLQKP